MNAIDSLLDQIRDGPRGPRIAAVFDFDGTLIDGYSAASFYTHRLRRFELGLGEVLRTASLLLGSTPTEEEFVALVERGVRGWVGRPTEELSELGERLFAREIAGRLFHEAWRLVKAHQLAGHTVVIASSATDMQVAPLARELEVEHVLCTRLAVDRGVLTGKVDGRSLWGPGKVAAVRDYLSERGVDLKKSHAYANGNEDLPLLECVGNPHPVNPQPQLAGWATDRGWPVLRFNSHRRNTFDPSPALRTAAVFGSLFVSAGTGIAVGVLNRDSHVGVDTALSMFDTLACPLADVNVEIIGEHNVWSHRPAVFILNHQSPLLDLVIATRVLHHGFVAVAKAEARRVPIVGQLLALAGVVFVERADRVKAVEALKPAVEVLRSGTSVVIAPEGTRSLTPRVGRFKKGAFHLAAQAGVPIVPIVIRNAGELMSRNALTMNSGTVQVVVHPPIGTEGWAADDINEYALEVQQLYVDTLINWPSEGFAAPHGQNSDVR